MIYNIQSWPTKIQSPKFTELMAYNEAANGITPSTPQFSGKIAAQRWYHGNPLTKPIYQFTYDGVGRLTAAVYSHNATVVGRTPKYSESFTYDAMGNITSLTRQGFLYSATWGDIDDLVMEYEGNRMVKCDDAAASQPTYSETHHFADLADASTEYEYDQNGNMTKDLKIPIKREQSKLVCFAEREEFGMKFNRNISKIEYNCLNLPEKTIILGDGMRTHIDNTYDAAGNKLRTTVGRQKVIGPFHPSSLGGVAEPQGGGIGGEIVNPIPSSTLITTDYCGNAIYRGDTLSMLLTEEGYVTFASDSTPVYHYYLKDHLGSIRVVFDQSGAVEQRNNYYPSGTLMYTSTNGTLQPYKFGGKELERTAGLDEYDFGARWMDPVIGGRFTTMDPLAEKYYGVSPYAYCGGDPVNRIDPDGEDDYWAFSDGKVLRFNRTDTDYDRLYGAVDNTIQSIQINDHEILQQLSSERTDFAGHYAVSSNADEVSKIFLFLANSTDVEWALVGYNTDKGKQYILNNSRNDYQNAEESVNRVSHIFPTEKMFINIHSHPRKDGCDFASGQSYYRYTEGNHYDLPVSDATTMNEVYLAVQKYYGNQYPMEFYPLFFIYNARTGKKIQYDNHYRNIDRGVVKRYQDLLKP